MSLRHLGHSWREVEAFLSKIGGMTARTSHKWSNIVVNNDFDEFTKDERRGKRGDSFWDFHPDLELEAKQFVYEECSKKEASFTAETLARFIDKRFYEVNDIKKVDPGKKSRTHTAAEFSVNDFGMKLGTRCPVDKIDFIDEKNQKRTIECYADDGNSKGLLALTYELNVFVPKKIEISKN
ncbi:unnamed protein product [Didymodactylos carnosus]|uniref:Uncharacterized protein n=1 Tax=Didymodactylos carnosus TaxID=1234261 RepID=A0A8S2F1Y8_9BILA|nr:unnamed protein product [Didymodactylos carnosus]CAF4142852.1 unnamed protein product [Didymodactylos carnosus]